MAHASGNATWVDYPSTATLVTATKLEALENTADALYVSEYGATSRTQRAIFKARRTTTLSIVAATDTFVTTGWTVDKDTETGWNAAGAQATYTIPYGGRLWDLYFLNRTDTTTNGGTIASKITLNGTNVGANSIASDARPTQGGEAYALAFRPAVALAAADVLRFAVWNTNAYTLGPGFGAVYPEIQIKDAGPA